MDIGDSSYTCAALNTERLKRVLLSLSDVVQRVRWLEAELHALTTPEAAHLLDALASESESGDPRARETLLSLAALLLHWGQNPSVQALRQSADQLGLQSLERLLRVDPTRPATLETEWTVPNYGQGRELTVGERRSLARRPSRRHVDRLLTDPHPLVVRQLLSNPSLTEDDLVRGLARRPLRRVTLAEVVEAPRWICRSRIRLAIILNPEVPWSVAMPLLGLCTRSELREIVELSSVSLTVRATARERLGRSVDRTS